MQSSVRYRSGFVPFPFAYATLGQSKQERKEFRGVLLGPRAEPKRIGRVD